jgi:cystathionine beta-lyase
VRLERHGANALAVARWLAARPEVGRILYPALADDPGHALWTRDFSGASGLFGFTLKGADDAARARFIDALTLFGIGFSWGGFESLAVPAWPAPIRDFPNGEADGALIRIHAGLEAPQDLIADLAAAFARVRAIRGRGQAS